MVQQSINNADTGSQITDKEVQTQAEVKTKAQAELVRAQFGSAPVILLRGLAREQQHWGQFPQLLQQHVSQPVYCVDLPGMGQHYMQRSPASLCGILTLVRRQLRQIEGPYHLLAMSLGAMLAMRFAELYPAEVLSLLLINSSAGDLTPFYQRLKWQSYPAVLAALCGSIAHREQLILQLTSNKAQVREACYPHFVALARQRPVSRSNALRQLWAASHFVLPDKPGCKVLLLGSRNDRLVDISASQQIAQRWQVPLLLHQSAGHDLALDDPDWLLAQAVRFYAAPE
ncbi:alpha/beta fold hydrolase [Rheinheimera sp. 4Y26]|uniref:alpha/beta fold hydrolase n=1 Tax=Rheinheimera sp. 4Y26 TaxID=2977811 RepID=UPI0021B0FEF2|nr:alpha/beta hydrolase [Rheinheimera sp. 4Y26]MCT6700300.1 alpha/beta hydrolase [Rheinheimera sp. 4Y26]